MSSIVTEINLLNEEINAAHYKHYETSKTGLVMPNEAPSANTIYHLYSNGEFTYQKGGDAYLRRSEFEVKPYIIGYEKLNLQLVKKMRDPNLTYVILTAEECIYFRKRMEDIIKIFNS